MLTVEVGRSARSAVITADRDEGSGASAVMEATHFHALFEREHGAILAYVSRRLPDGEVEDVVAETFTALWQGRTRIPDLADVRPWLFGIARRQVAAAQRARGLRGNALTAWAAISAGVPVITPDVACAVVDTDQARRIHAALGYRDAEVLQLSGWEGLTTPQIALVLGCSEVVVRQRLSRARRRLAELIECDERNPR